MGTQIGWATDQHTDIKTHQYSSDLDTRWGSNSSKEVTINIGFNSR